MAFAIQLEESLRHRESQVASEFANGDALGEVLTRYLLAVEAAADTDMLTSILLLDGNCLHHGAAPNLPGEYCDAIDGAEIGPNAGSCGTAAYFGYPVYVTDIATDPLWDDYRAIALEYGLRACWSTPISNDQGAVIGTFAIYHLTPRSPTRDEVQAIRTITEHVARAIILASGAEGPSSGQIGRTATPFLKLVANENDEKFPLLDVERHFEALVDTIDAALAQFTASEPDDVCLRALQRAKAAAEKGAALARSGYTPE